MSKITRTPTFAGGEITPEEKAKMDAHAALWISRAMRTEPIEPAKIIPAIVSLYAAAGLKEPRVIIVPSPGVMAFAGGFATAIWNKRKANATVNATDNATANATANATRNATVNATANATDNATRNATANATYNATRNATDNATYNATVNATANATRNATANATRNATDNATYNATDNATRNATANATDNATYNATDNATYNATYNATANATVNATRNEKNWPYELALQIFGNRNDALFALRTAQGWWQQYQGGNMWAAWDCYLTAGRDILGLKLPEHEKYAAWEQCAIHGGFRYMDEEFCMVCDFPEILTKDEQHRPHGENGPSHRWRDGWELYHWHGVRLEADKQWIVTNPGAITVELINAEQNAEIKRIMLERFGYDRYLTAAGATVVAEAPADHPLKGARTARLLVKDVGEEEPICMVDALNSTPEPDGSTKRYMILVDPKAYNGRAGREIEAALASTWRNQDGSLYFKKPEEYRPHFES